MASSGRIALQTPADSRGASDRRLSSGRMLLNCSGLALGCTHMTSQCECNAQVPAYTAGINTLQYNPALCINCGMCSIVCPHAVFAPDGKVARLIRPEACMECGACKRNRLAGAISVDSGDCSFYPVRDHNQGRWLGVATARQEEKSLPPVELIQVGDVYFVRDGHHRISVARALGQPVIEAEVWA